MNKKLRLLAYMVAVLVVASVVAGFFLTCEKAHSEEANMDLREKVWDHAKSGASVVKDKTVTGYRYGQKGARYFTDKVKDVTASAYSAIKNAFGRVYRNKDEYMHSDAVKKIREISSMEELRDAAEAMKDVVNSDAVRKGVSVLNEKSAECVKSKKCRDVVSAGIYAGTGSTVASGLIAASGMSAVGMIGGGAGVGAATGPVGAVAGATVGLAVYGIIKAFSDKEKELDVYTKNHTDFNRGFKEDR